VFSAILSSKSAGKCPFSPPFLFISAVMGAYLPPIPPFPTMPCLGTPAGNYTGWGGQSLTKTVFFNIKAFMSY
jgi:hypothetical protein